MPVFSYQGCDKTGTADSGTIEAGTEALAFETLQSRGITVFDLSAGAHGGTPQLPWYRRDIQLWGHQLPYEDQANTADLLATLFGAGLSASEVIRIAGVSLEQPQIARQFERVGQRLADGHGFADAFEAENRLFSPIFVSFLKVSDTANTLPQLLKDLARFFHKQNAVQQKVASALIYPAILMCAAIALLLIVVLYLAPNLAPIFASVGKEPPGTLAALLAVNAGLRSYWPLFLAGVFGSVVGGLVLVQIPAAKAALIRSRLHLPIFGRLARMSALARLAQATELLLAAGMPLAQALRTAARVMGAASGFEGTFQDAADAIEAGATASEVLDTDRHIPPGFKELFRIGETTNRLPSTLSALSESLSAQVDRHSQRLLGLLTPALTLVLGLGIGFLIYTLMGAILEVNELAF